MVWRRKEGTADAWTGVFSSSDGSRIGGGRGGPLLGSG